MHLLVPSIIVWVYAILVMAGGIMGYVKARSKPSIIAGIVSGVVLLIAGAAMRTGQSWGLALSLAVIALLLISFGMRYGRSAERKFMPGGLMILLSIAALVAVLATMRAG